MQTRQKKIGLFAGVCWLALQLLAGTNDGDVKLTGIIHLPDFEYSLLEHRNKDSEKVDQLILKERQRDSGVEVIAIHAREGTVEVLSDGATAKLALKRGIL